MQIASIVQYFTWYGCKKPAIPFNCTVKRCFFMLRVCFGVYMHSQFMCFVSKMNSVTLRVVYKHVFIVWTLAEEGVSKILPCLSRTRTSWEERVFFIYLLTRLWKVKHIDDRYHVARNYAWHLYTTQDETTPRTLTIKMLSEDIVGHTSTI